MKKLLVLLLFIPTLSYGADIGTFNPILDGQKTLTISCVDPTEREDNSPLNANEIKHRTYYLIETNPDTPTAFVLNECLHTVDLTQLNDGYYTSHFTATDTDDRESVRSIETIEFTILAVQPAPKPPMPPSSVTGVVN